MTVTTNVIRTVNEVSPAGAHELTAHSHVQVSAETPEYTETGDALVTLRRLEALQILGVKSRVKFCQMSTSTPYGEYQDTRRTEKTALYWHSPNAVAKLFHRNNRISFESRGCAATTPREPGFHKAYMWYAAIAAQCRDLERMTR